MPGDKNNIEIQIEHKYKIKAIGALAMLILRCDSGIINCRLEEIKSTRKVERYYQCVKCITKKLI
jgi:hypothetical protein